MTDDTCFALVTYVAIIVLAVTGTGITDEVVSDAVQKTLAWFAVGWFALFLLLITPYRMWAEQAVEIAEAKESTRPMPKSTERMARAICDTRSWSGVWIQASDAERRGWVRDAEGAQKAQRLGDRFTNDQGVECVVVPWNRPNT